MARGGSLLFKGKPFAGGAIAAHPGFWKAWPFSPLDTNHMGLSMVGASLAVAFLVWARGSIPQTQVLSSRDETQSIVQAAPPSPVSVPPNASHITATVLRQSVWLPRSLQYTVPPVPSNQTHYSFMVEIHTSGPETAALGLPAIIESLGSEGYSRKHAWEMQASGQRSRNQVLMFFYIVNQTDNTVQVKVFADERELFVQQLRAKLTPLPGQQAPEASAYPAVELKIPMPRDVKKLEVEVSPMARRVSFDIGRFIEMDAGFQITIGQDEVRVTQDYYPILRR